MTTELKKNNEKLFLAIVELIFVGLYIYVDGWYSSLAEMPGFLKILIWVGRCLLVGCAVIGWVKFNNPDYDKYRWYTIIICIALALTIGIHHATTREDEQVIIDSHENATKP